jgi:sugar-specific transcriptional regulator TrmB
MNIGESIPLLMDFGLSFLQATIYLNLVKFDEADVKLLAKDTNVARQDIYRIMPTLEKLGLAEKIIAKPTRYRATPINESLCILLENKKQKYNDLLKKKDLLLDSFPIANKNACPSESTQYIITSEATLFLKTHQKLIQKTQESIDIILPTIKVPMKFENEWLLVKNMMETKKNLKIRLITQKPSEDELPHVIWGPLIENPSFQVKYSDAPIQFGMHIFDNKQITLQVCQDNVLPSLWSNNPHVLIIAAGYFNEEWNKTHAEKERLR